MMRVLRNLAPTVRPFRKQLAIGTASAGGEVLVALAQPWPLKFVIDRVLTAPNRPANATMILTFACICLGSIVGVTALLDYWSTRLLSSTGLRIASAMREEVFAHVSRLSLRFHGENRVGDLAARVTSDVDKTQDMVVQTLAVLLPNMLQLIGMVVVMMVLDALLGLIALALTPLLVVAVTRSTRQLKRASRKSRAADGRVAAATSEHLSAIHLVQAFTLEAEQEREFGRLTEKSLSAGIEAARVQARFSPIVDATAVLSTVAVIWLGSHRALNGKMSVGDLLVFVSYVGSAYKPLKALAKLGGVISKGTAAFERVTDVLEQQPQIRDSTEGTKTRPLRGGIEFRNVSFTYGRETVLSNINLTVAPGETVALVGPTGAGKSTIASLVPRLIEPTEGSVLLDGFDSRDLALHGVRNQVSMVLQDCALLSGTLHDNIRVGRPGAAQWEIEQAAKLALVTEFADRLPDGLDTIVGERGADLSGGQRQRISIARAILRNAPILILDEPTSALDAESESAIVKGLGALMKGRTTLVIAHRLSTVRSADRLVVIDGGSIVEQGTHDELLARRGVYFRLHHLQTSTPTLSFAGASQ